MSSECTILLPASDGATYAESDIVAHLQQVSSAFHDADDYLADMLLTLKSLVRGNCVLEVEDAVYDRDDALCSKRSVHVFESGSLR